VVSRGGACLIPVFALGRAQELLLILDEYWQAHPELQNIPIYYASKLASKALRVYQTFINTMSDHIRQMMDISNPFKLRNIHNMLNTDEFVVQGPCVVMAAPGFLQSGVSRQLFDRWCEDSKNCVLIAGYTVEGTLAHDLLSAPKEVTGMDNRIRSRNCDIEHITFSAHVDFAQNSAFIRAVMPDNIILVHGEKTGMGRLKGELERWAPRTRFCLC
jgi:cleavage and polyadenylation specificity factor subunit 3